MTGDVPRGMSPAIFNLIMKKMLEAVAAPESWEQFYKYKTELICSGQFVKELREFIDRRGFERVCESIAAGEPFPLPRRSVISKLSTGKKRTVYVYPPDENMVLKLLTYLLLRKYDHLFSDNLYSFRPGRSAKDAVRRLLREGAGNGTLFAYKVDIHNYFNSIPIDRLVPMLGQCIDDDPELLTFLRSLLENPHVYDRGNIISEDKGIMAGTPVSSFYANVYLRELDAYFESRGIIYARYSDDIIVFGSTLEETEQYAAVIRSFLERSGLSVNPDKEDFFAPEDGWVFLGFSVNGGTVDIAPATVLKLKHKMRRKANSLVRWAKRNGVDGKRAATAFIRIFNRKLLEGPKDSRDNELTWSYWFFSVITTADSLKVIDNYAQECIRFIASGKHTKARFDLRYDDMKALGYRNLVHAYYEYSRDEAKPQEPLS